jgi:hypothetical protein
MRFFAAGWGAKKKPVQIGGYRPETDRAESVRRRSWDWLDVYLRLNRIVQSLGVTHADREIRDPP